MNSIEFHCYHFKVMTPNKKEVKAKYKNPFVLIGFQTSQALKENFCFKNDVKVLLD